MKLAGLAFLGLVAVAQASIQEPSNSSKAGPAFTEPKCNGKQVMVHLFEWSWRAVAKECEEVLGPKGFCGVQVSPVTEHILGDAWWTRYQPVSYKLDSRSGNREEFIDMVQRCNAAGVNVITDLVYNHMSAGGTGPGWAGSDFNGQDYPAVPYSTWDFHQPPCDINDYNNPYEVRNCYLVGLNDLDHSKDYVKDRIAELVNDVIDIGVRGLRIDASKHMWPGDLESLQSRFHTVDGESIMIIHEVIDHGGEAISSSEYTGVGKVTEFRAGDWLACVRNNDLNCLSNFGDGLLGGFHALTFVDNHDNQRTGGALTYKDDYHYKLANAFNLAHPYGFKRVMSSYYFDDPDQGPPSGDPGCFDGGWVCEHRWSTTVNMVRFANAVSGTGVDNWQYKEGTLGFSRGDKGFFAMGDLNNVSMFTGLPDGEYCDLIHDCAQMVSVSGGWATLNKAEANDPVVAICVGCS